MKIKERVQQLQYQKVKQHSLARALSERRPVAQVKDGLIRQPLNHFDSLNTKTFPQRFFVNDAFWERPNGPVFLYIGGEGPISEFSVLAGHHVDMAEEYGALLVALEHRFYGNSINPDGLETENLRDLSSQQALADLAAFHQYISQRFSLSHKNTWISFGGSYSGALSAWLRGKFPHLIYGAVASSAPVKAKLDFSTYNKVVGLSLMNEKVGGSDKCVGDVWEAFAAVEAALLGGNSTQVGRDFACCQTPRDLRDQTELMRGLADVVMGTVQYNEEGAVLSIAELCRLMTNESEAYEEEMEAYDRLVRLVQVYRSTGEDPCLDASHEQAVSDLRNTDLNTASMGQRQWLYQSCSEFGFFQTCEDASCPFSRMLTLQAQTELCPLLFNIPQNRLHQHVSFTNQYYGGNHPSTQRVLYVNGDIDPWSELSVHHSGLQDQDTPIVIQGSAHCADMNPTSTHDRPALTVARQDIEKHVGLWLKSAAWENMG